MGHGHVEGGWASCRHVGAVSSGQGVRPQGVRPQGASQGCAARRWRHKRTVQSEKAKAELRDRMRDQGKLAGATMDDMEEAFVALPRPWLPLHQGCTTLPPPACRPLVPGPQASPALLHTPRNTLPSCVLVCVSPCVVVKHSLCTPSYIPPSHAGIIVSHSLMHRPPCRMPCCLRSGLGATGTRDIPTISPRYPHDVPAISP